jgi:hypothetical protein
MIKFSFFHLFFHIVNSFKTAGFFFSLIDCHKALTIELKTAISKQFIYSKNLVLFKQTIPFVVMSIYMIIFRNNFNNKTY